MKKKQEQKYQQFKSSYSQAEHKSAFNELVGMLHAKPHGQPKAKKEVQK